MSGIQVHTEEPIHKRTSPPSATATNPASASAITTTAALPTGAASGGYVPPVAAQPGARPPGPTSSAYTPAGQLQPTPTSAYTPASTTSVPSSTSPAPPQPGALPTPTAATSTRRSASPLPPPPKAGEKLQSPEYYQTQPVPQQTPAPSYGSGGGIPPPAGGYVPSAAMQGTLQQPTRGVPPAGQTGTAPGVIAGGPTGGFAPAPYGAEMPRRSLDHPPGYVQDPYAGDRGPAGYGYGNHNSSSGDMQGERKGSIFGGLGETFSGLTGGGGGGGASGGGGGGGGILGGGGGGGEEGIMGTMGSWAKGVGKKAAELESEVWKRVNGEK